jgi:hypothetical protein
MRPSRAVSLQSVAVGAGTPFLIARARRRYLRWGATDEEVNMSLPGDELVSDADITSTRAITVDAAPDCVWPWIAQLGQGRGGFYTYDVLENLVGCAIHNADQIHSEWQSIAMGDVFRLHPEVGLSVALVEPGRALVVRGGIPMGPVPPPYDFTWAFVVHGVSGGTTRLVVRERYGYTRWWSALLVEPVQLISFIMSQGMLRGIRQRAEQAVASSPSRPSASEYRFQPA